MRLLIEYAIKRIVCFPEQVFVAETINGYECVIKVRVSPDDIGKVIGKNGATIKILRRMANALGDLQSRKIILDIVK